MHSKGKGMSSSALPYKRTPPSWLKITQQEVVDSICRLARKGATPSAIGVELRDKHGIAQVGAVTGSKILRILKGSGLAPELPEDLFTSLRSPYTPRERRAPRSGQTELPLGRCRPPHQVRARPPRLARAS